MGGRGRLVAVALGISAVAVGFAGGEPVRAQVAAAPADWPCAQTYVPEIALAQVWRGPDLGGVDGQWAADPLVAPLVPQLAASELSIAEAVEKVREFARTVPSEEREARLLRLMRGLFEILSAERRRTIEGALTFARHQKQLTARIREESDRLRAMQREGAPAEEIAALQERLNWDLRIFEDRRATASAVCEQPDVVEKRLFELARAIAEELAQGRKS